MTFTNKAGVKLVTGLVATIQQNKDFLSEVDGKIGDGDHGINMNKGFTLCGERLAEGEHDMSSAFMVLSETLMDDIGGSMGPLYGVFFEGLSTQSEGKAEIDAGTFLAMLEEGLAGIQDIGSAKVGDKTLLDTLCPAVEAMRTAVEQGKDFAAALDEMDAAAKAGWQSTENMVAKIGRASRLGERSRGVLDAGATSCWLILDSMAKTAKELLG